MAKKPLKPLPPIVRTLGWISFLADVCSEMTYPILPLFLTGVLRAPAWVLGVVEGFSEAVVSVMKGWSGWHSDKKGVRAPYIQVGYFLSALGKPLIGIATGWPLVFFARALDRVGKGVRTTARDAMIADAADKEDYGRAFGFHRAMDTAGAFLGVLLCLGLLTLFPGQYRMILLMAFVPGLLAVGLAMRVREPKPTGAAAESAPRTGKIQLKPQFWWAIGVVSLFGLANSSDTFLILRAKSLGLSEPQAIGAYLVFNLVAAALSTWAGHLSDRWSRMNVIALGWTLYALVYAGFALLGKEWVFVAFGLYGVYIAMSHGVVKAFAASLTTSESRGTAIGIFSMVSGLVTLLGNVAFGAIWEFVSPSTALLCASAVAGVAAISLFMLRPLFR